MKAEIQAAVSFFKRHHLGPDASRSKLDQMSSMLQDRFQGHWYPEDPERGSAYRAIHPTDTCLPDPSEFSALLDNPRWMLWIDPGCVSFRPTEERDAILQEVYGKLPAYLVAVDDPTTRGPAPLPLIQQQVEELLTSPVKRSKAIQIIRPDQRKPSSSVLPALEVAPPTPIPSEDLSRTITGHAMVMPESPCVARSVSPIQMERPSSRASSISDASSTCSSLFDQVEAGRKPSHSRSNSSASYTSQGSAITRPSSSCSVTEHSNGKVGVLGGGVLLGLPASGSCSSSEESSENEEVDPFTSGMPVSNQGQRRRRVRSHGRHHTGSASSLSAAGAGPHSRNNSIHKLPSQQMMKEWQQQARGSAPWANNMDAFKPAPIYIRS